MNIECIFYFYSSGTTLNFLCLSVCTFNFFNWMLLNFTFLYRSCLIKVNKILKHTKNSDNKFFKLKENKNKKVNCPNLLVCLFSFLFFFFFSRTKQVFSGKISWLCSKYKFFYIKLSFIYTRIQKFHKKLHLFSFFFIFHFLTQSWSTRIYFLTSLYSYFCLIFITNLSS